MLVGFLDGDVYLAITYLGSRAKIDSIRMELVLSVDIRDLLIEHIKSSNLLYQDTLKPRICVTNGMFFSSLVLFFQSLVFVRRYVQELLVHE